MPSSRWSEEPALSLALLRIVVPAMVLVSPGFFEGARVATWDPARWVAPEGLGWFVAWVPVSARLAVVVQVVTAFLALLAIVGIRARLALAGLTVSAFYLFSIAQLTGFVWHDMHLLWFVALLAASPCDDVLAYDATRSPLVGGREYARPLVLARLLLGAVYFFPGLHKLMTSGLGWALSDNLRNQLYWKWLQHGATDPWRIDQVPGALQAGGLFLLAFELGFPLLLWTRRTRALAAALGLAFHLFAQAVFRIPFASLWICYVVLVDPRPVACWLIERVPSVGVRLDPTSERSHRAPPSWLPIVVGGALLVGVVVQGARGQMRSYPFACYPTFQWPAADVMPDLMIVRVDGEGREREIRHARDRRGFRTQRQWAEVWSLAGVWGPADPERLRAYLMAITSHRSEPGVVRVYRAYRFVDPDRRDTPPVERRLLLETSSR